MLQSVCQNREYCNVRGRKIPRIAIDITRERERGRRGGGRRTHTHTAYPRAISFGTHRMHRIRVLAVQTASTVTFLSSLRPLFLLLFFPFFQRYTFVTVDINNRIAFTLTFSCRASYHHTHTTVKLHNRYFLDTIAMATLIALMVAMR